MTRVPELERIDGLARAAGAGRSGGLVLVGEPGAGKSWLCEQAVERARGFRVVATRGVRSESQLGYAGLFDVLSPLLEGNLDGLAPPRAHALRVALRLEGPAIVDPLAVAVACLDVLAAAAELLPLLIVVDDAHWIDEASLEALRFAGRRLDADRVGLLFALRPEGEASFANSGFEVLRIGGLAEADAVAALEAFAALPVHRSVARHVVAASAGNPLALSEAARSLSAHQLAGRAELPADLPQPASLQPDYQTRASTLPAGTRQALTLLAVGEAAGDAVFERAMSELEQAMDAFAPAVAAGLVRLESSRPRFLHPLTQAAAWHDADPQTRRAAHRAMATAWTAAEDHERAAWHLADAVDGPDAAASLALAGAARAARARGAPREAAQAWHRAAEMEVDASEIMRLGFEEACDLARAGRTAALLDHVARMLDAGPPAALRADLELLRGDALLWNGRVQEAASLFEAAARDVPASDPGRGTLLLSGSAFARARAGDFRGAVESATAALELAEDVGGGVSSHAHVILAWTLVLAGEAPRGYPRLLRWSRESPGGLPGPEAGAMFGQLAVWMEDYGTARRELEGSVARARAAGCVSELPHALSALAELEFRLGEWTASRRLTDEAIRLATDIGQDHHWDRVPLVQLAVVTGDTDGARAHVAVILDAARLTGSPSLDIYASAALGLLELGLDAPDAAAKQLERVQALVEETGLGEPNVVQWRADMIESQCRAGRAADAARSLATLEREANATGRRWALAAAARCRALLAPGADIDRAFAHAHRLAADEPSPFELARTELCWGERLRREHHRVDARRHLNMALERFQALGAAPWAEKAARELRSSGARARRGPKQSTRELTASESQIAALVAEGRTNKDIAASLFLSPKTIEFHLGRIYRKLDIHSRTQLARALLLETSTSAGYPADGD